MDSNSVELSIRECTQLYELGVSSSTDFIYLPTLTDIPTHKSVLTNILYTKHKWVPAYTATELMAMLPSNWYITSKRDDESPTGKMFYVYDEDTVDIKWGYIGTNLSVALQQAIFNENKENDEFSIEEINARFNKNIKNRTR